MPQATHPFEPASPKVTPIRTDTRPVPGNREAFRDGVLTAHRDVVYVHKNFSVDPSAPLPSARNVVK